MNNLIKITEGHLAGNIFYGTIRINDASVIVGNLIKDETKEQKFRMIGKARAGFPLIHEVECKISDLPYYLSKHTTYVEYQTIREDGKIDWWHILTTKGGKWHSIEKSLLESLSVGDMHNAFPKMIDWKIWKAMNTKFHSCKSFVLN
tara:strand:- start:65 stop:505 length:441 start_codon:yes stop_codon:yes gene_type:complete